MNKNDEIKLLAEARFIGRLITETTPTGIVSVVSDSYDFWGVVTKVLPALKEKIMTRDGTVVIRPDSGDPVDILCGKPLHYIDDKHNGCWDSYKKEMDSLGLPYQIEECEYKGLIECLWDTFGGTVTESGLKLLDSHIGAIYGDSITLERQDQIIKRLTAKGFVPSVVLGIGSYTYQYVTRDTHGSAVKATCVQKGEGQL